MHAREPLSSSEHPDEVKAEYVLGEIGAFSMHLFGRTFYPIQVAEKGICWVRATFEGSPGHGSMPDPKSAVNRLARAVGRLSKKRLPMHPTPVVRAFIDQIATEIPRPQRDVLRRLTTPQVASLILDYLVRDPDQQRFVRRDALEHRVAHHPRRRSQGERHPGSRLGRYRRAHLPGSSEPEFLQELREAFGRDGRDARIDVLDSRAPVETSPNTPLFAHLARTIRKHDPAGIPLPVHHPRLHRRDGVREAGREMLRLCPHSLRCGIQRELLAHVPRRRRAHPRRGAPMGAACALRGRSRLHRARGVRGARRTGRPFYLGELRVNAPERGTHLAEDGVSRIASR